MPGPLAPAWGNRRAGHRQGPPEAVRTHASHPQGGQVHRQLPYTWLPGVSLAQLCSSPRIAPLTFSPLRLATALAETNYFKLTNLHADMRLQKDLRVSLRDRRVGPLPGLYFRPRGLPTPRVEYPEGLVAAGLRPFPEGTPQNFADVTPHTSIRGRDWVLDPMLQVHVGTGSGPASQRVLFFWAKTGFREAFCTKEWQADLQGFFETDSPELAYDMDFTQGTDEWEWVSLTAPAQDFPPTTPEILREAAEAMGFTGSETLTALAGLTPDRRGITAVLWGPKRGKLWRFTNAIQLWLKKASSSRATTKWATHAGACPSLTLRRRWIRGERCSGFTRSSP